MTRERRNLHGSVPDRGRSTEDENLIEQVRGAAKSGQSRETSKRRWARAQVDSEMPTVSDFFDGDEGRPSSLKRQKRAWTAVR